jgi:hypothetical protein
MVVMESIAAQPFCFPEPVQAAMAKRDPVATGAELLAMEAGFRALLVGEDKRPYGTLTPGGVHDATDDPFVLQQWANLFPDSSLAIVQPPWMATIDIDDPSVRVDGVPAGTWTERTTRGTHHLVGLPAPLLARRRLPEGGGDVLVGPSTYVVFSPSAGRVPIDVAAPVLPLDPLSSLWREIAPTEFSTNSLDTVQFSTITPEVERTARAVLNRLNAGTFGDTVAAILDGHRPERYPSRSEADLGLALLATHITRTLEVIVAVLMIAALKRDHTDFAYYCTLTATKALKTRSDLDRERHERLRSILMGAGYSRGSVYDVTSKGEMGDLASGIMRFASISVEDEFSRFGGWRRLPVEDMAVVYGCHRQTVWRQVRELSRAGTIDYDYITVKADTGPRKDSLVRLITN